MGTRERLVELSDRLARGELAALRDFLAPEYFGYTPGADEPAANDRITDLALGFQAGLPDLSATLDDITEAGDGTATATATIRGTFTGNLWGAPGSGESVEWVTPVTVRPVGDRFAVRFDEAATPTLVGLIRQLRLVNPADQMDQPPIYEVTRPDFLLKLVFTGEAGDRPCRHLDDIKVLDPTTAACEQCEAAGDIWPALRLCLVCGFVGCCDTSKNRHMIQHKEETGHCIMRSIHGDEAWIWCYDDDAFFEGTLLDRYR